jgi:dihydropteroate synthase
MVNDVSGFGDPQMAEVVVRHGAAWVLMHMPHAVGAMPWSQASAAMPHDLAAGVAQVVAGLQDCVGRAVAAGVAPGQLAVDPGIGFGKTVAQNLALLHIPPALAKLGLPVYVGPSRKSFIAAVARDHPSPAQREPGTAAAVTAAVLGGAAFVRVHDVAAMRQVVDVAHALRLAR